VWLEDYRARPRQAAPAGLRPLSQISALKRSPRALGVPYRGRMGKRDALARLAFGSPPPCDRTRPVLPVEFGDNPPALTKFLLASPINGARGMINDEKRFVDRDNSIMFASRVVASLS
jgi:hypothetical protein